ncbi:hypothetical protein FVE85_3340 [Porphyridium purpureum]|uniref:RING-type domain-containing protein n=1 Tax=Porphyridium purpureum TaxID=35688 RepID=A0A5J4YUB8_PORPP|nr:hypothetical protein FVE85_3340 [Porphyridium purpureum]|eukprot:POR7218..scf227_4
MEHSQVPALHAQDHERATCEDTEHERAQTPNGHDEMEPVRLAGDTLGNSPTQVTAGAAVHVSGDEWTALDSDAVSCEEDLDVAVRTSQAQATPLASGSILPADEDDGAEKGDKSADTNERVEVAHAVDPSRIKDEGDLIAHLQGLGLSPSEVDTIVAEQRQIREDELMAMRLIHIDPIEETHPGGLDAETICVVCFEKSSHAVIEPCMHRNVCISCLSNLTKCECPTCRIKLSHVQLVDAEGTLLARRTGEWLLGLRKRCEFEAWSRTYQVVFVGSSASDNERSRDAAEPYSQQQQLLLATELVEREADGSLQPSATRRATGTGIGASSKPAAALSSRDFWSMFTDTKSESLFHEELELAFAPNARFKGVGLKVSALLRTSFASRRMILEDLKCFRPDAVVICATIPCMPPGVSELSASATCVETQKWNRLLRQNSTLPRIWLLWYPEDVLSLEDERERLRASVLSMVSRIEVVHRPRAVIFAHTEEKGDEEPWQQQLLRACYVGAQLGRATRSSLLPVGVAFPTDLPGAEREASGLGNGGSFVANANATSQAILTGASAGLTSLWTMLSSSVWDDAAAQAEETTVPNRLGSRGIATREPRESSSQIERPVDAEGSQDLDSTDQLPPSSGGMARIRATNEKKKNSVAEVLKQHLGALMKHRGCRADVCQSLPEPSIPPVHAHK